MRKMTAILAVVMIVCASLVIVLPSGAEASETTQVAPEADVQTRAEEKGLDLTYSDGSDSISWGTIDGENKTDVPSLNSLYITNIRDDRTYVNLTLTLNDLYGEPNNLLITNNYYIAYHKGTSDDTIIEAVGKKATITETLAYNERFTITFVIKQISQWVGGNMTGTFFITGSYYIHNPMGAPMYASDTNTQNEGSFYITLLATQAVAYTWPYNVGGSLDGIFLGTQEKWATTDTGAYQNQFTVKNAGSAGVTITKITVDIGYMYVGGNTANAYINDYSFNCKWSLLYSVNSGGPWTTVTDNSVIAPVDADATNGIIAWTPVVAITSGTTVYCRLQPDSDQYQYYASGAGYSSFDWVAPQDLYNPASGGAQFQIKVTYGGLGSGDSTYNIFRSKVSFSDTALSPSLQVFGTSSNPFDFDLVPIDLLGGLDTANPAYYDFESVIPGATNIWGQDALCVDNTGSTITINELTFTFPQYIYLSGNTGDTTNRIGIGNGANMGIIWSRYADASNIATVNDYTAGTPLTGRGPSAVNADNVGTSVVWAESGSSSGATFSTYFTSTNYIGTTVTTTDVTAKSCWVFKLDSIPSIATGSYYNLGSPVTVAFRHNWARAYSPALAPTSQGTFNGIEISTYDTMIDFDEASSNPFTYSVILNNTEGVSKVVNISENYKSYNASIDYPSAVTIGPNEVVEIQVNATFPTNILAYHFVNMTFESNSEAVDVDFKARPPVIAYATIKFGSRGTSTDIKVNYIDGSTGFHFSRMATGQVSDNIGLLTNVGRYPLTKLSFTLHPFTDEAGTPISDLTYHLKTTDGNEYYPDEDGKVTFYNDGNIVLGIGKLMAFQLVIDDVPEGLNLSEEYLADITGEAYDINQMGYDLVPIDVVSTAYAPPVADAGDDMVVVVNETFILSAEGSYDNDGTIVEWAWDVDNDGDFDLLGEQVSYEFDTTGVKSVTLRVKDDDDNIATDVIIVSVMAENALFSLSENEIAVDGETGEDVTVQFQVSVITDVLVKIQALENAENTIYGKEYDILVEDDLGNTVVEQFNVTTEQVTMFTSTGQETYRVYITMRFTAEASDMAVFKITAVDTENPLQSQEANVEISYSIVVAGQLSGWVWIGLGLFTVVIAVVFILAWKARADFQVKAEEVQTNRRRLLGRRNR